MTKVTINNPDINNKPFTIEPVKIENIIIKNEIKNGAIYDKNFIIFVKVNVKAIGGVGGSGIILLIYYYIINQAII